MPDPRAGSQASKQPARNLGIAELRAGALLSGRYEILSTLGEGGMGAVYKARDREVDRVVAVKVIRPELANQPEILSRFKQELILSRQVTHKNVVRIFDLGEAEGIKFITMEFVEGRDLRALLRDGTPVSLEQKVKIVIQVCRALEAAHAEGVVHRDLKPQNILVENTGRVVVMDFGIAHSMQEAGATSTGMLLGTPLYMSPEQAKGEKVDPRSDIYTLGIVFYEVLTGKVPFESDTVVGLLLKRLQERPVPPVERNKEIPQALSDIVIKCLAVQKEDRYQSAEELQRDLEGWLGSPTTFRTVMGTHAAKEGTGKTPEGSTIVTPRMMMMARSGAWKWISLSVAIAAVIIAGVFVAMRLLSKPAAPHSPVTVMIADISNHTGDRIFDGTLEPMLKIALEGAGFISAYDRTQLRNLGAQPADKLDEQAARRIAVSQGLGVVISGSLDRQGAGYRLSLRATQAVTGNPIAKSEEAASNKDQVLFAVTKATAPVRKALGDATSESDQLFAMETLSASSLEAAHEYSIATDSLYSGKFEEARTAFAKATDLDPNFGLAYAGLAVISRNLGQQQDSDKYIKLAIAHIDHMTERERYRTRGFFYLSTGNRQKCVEEYGALINRYPSDARALGQLAICSVELRNMPQALDQGRRAVEILPKHAILRNNLALHASYAGDFQMSEREARVVQQLNPSYAKGYIALAFAQLGQGELSQAAETYQKLEKVSTLGASFAASGLADLALFEGRFGDAVRILERGAVTDLQTKNSDLAAAKFAALAYTQLSRGQKSAALVAAQSALTNSKAVSVRFLAARIFAGAGDLVRARAMASDLASELQAEPQAYAKLIEGQVALANGDARAAIKASADANNLLDTWIGHFDRGRAYLEAGAFTEADSEFDACVRRRGEVMALFLDEVPTYGYFPPVYYYWGRVRQELKSSAFAESYRTYLNIRGKAGEDPLLADVRRRVGQ